MSLQPLRIDDRLLHAALPWLALSPEGEILTANEALASLLGHPLTTLSGAYFADLIPASSRPALVGALMDARAGLRAGELLQSWEDPARTRHVRLSWTLATHEGATPHVSVIILDETERVEAMQAARHSELRYRLIADTAIEGIWALAPSGETLYANAQMAELLGRNLQELYTLRVAELLEPELATLTAERLATRAERGREVYDLPYAHPDGTRRILRVAVTPLPSEEGGPEGSLAMVSDVTDARRHESELRHDALHDPLTGLPRRELLFDRLSRSLERDEASPHASSTAVLFVELDQFRLVSSSGGLRVGDALLVEVSRRLTAALRPHDTVARFGDGQFLVLCENVDDAAARALGTVVLEAFERPFEVDGRSLHVSVSVGVTCSATATDPDPQRFADTAMYAAHAADRGTLRVFDRSLAVAAAERYEVAADLRRALAADLLTMHYQPILDLGTGEVLGAEALARWNHPTHGPVPPRTFVALAEEAGFAAELDRWALRRALRDAARMRSAGALPEGRYVAVNLSARNLGDLSLESYLLEEVRAEHLTPHDVVLEVAESAVLAKPHAAATLLARLCAHGFRVALDDFGTGHGSLAHLRELPLTALKIDAGFTADITSSREGLAIIVSILDLARAVGLSVVAEGVERPEQAALLRTVGCAAAQGWLWAKAAPLDEVIASAALVRDYPTAPLPPSPEDRSSEDATAAHGLPRLLQLHLEGASFASIASALNAEGYPAPGGVRWHRRSVARALTETAEAAVAGSPRS